MAAKIINYSHQHNKNTFCIRCTYIDYTSFVFIFTGLSSDSCLLIANMLWYEHRISRHFNATITRKLFRIFYHIGSRVMDCEHRQFSHTLDLYSQWILTTKIRASKGKKNILLLHRWEKLISAKIHKRIWLWF